MSSFLVDSLATTDALSDIFSDASIVQTMLHVEVGLAQAESREGLIPATAADAIAESGRAEFYDAVSIARAARDSGSATIPLVAALRERVGARDPSAARFVHWGATSQDVSDSTIVLLLSRAYQVLLRDHQRLDGALRKLSDAHAQTLMLARTLLQPAPPITFGLKVAGWAAALSRGWSRVSQAANEGLILQCGGAAGTLAALGSAGPSVAKNLGQLLGLRRPEAPWHTQRDRLAAILTACAIYTASLGKMARDISLLMQDEVREVSETGGRSSTMPHKRNPSGCAIVLAAATRVPGLVATFLTAMVQEHERSIGGWHAEWPTIASTVQATGAALEAAARVIDDLIVHPDAMRKNLEATRGTVLAERAMLLLARPLGRDVAQQVVEAALTQVNRTGRTFGDALRDLPEVTRALSADVLATIDRAEDYLGSAEPLRRQLLDAATGGHID